MAEFDVRYVHSLREIRLYRADGRFWPISVLSQSEEDRSALEVFLQEARASHLQPEAPASKFLPIRELVDKATGPTGGWLISPKQFVRELAEIFQESNPTSGDRG